MPALLAQKDWFHKPSALHFPYVAWYCARKEKALRRDSGTISSSFSSIMDKMCLIRGESCLLSKVVFSSMCWWEKYLPEYVRGQLDNLGLLYSSLFPPTASQIQPIFPTPSDYTPTPSQEALCSTGLTMERDTVSPVLSILIAPRMSSWHPPQMPYGYLLGFLLSDLFPRRWGFFVVGLLPQLNMELDHSNSGYHF